MRRILLFLVALLAVSWWLRRGKRTRPETRAPERGAPDAIDTLVRDRVCNTFLPRSRALVVETAGEDLFFCSEACREHHLGSTKRRQTT